MKQEQWQLAGNGPENYERFQVPNVFGPLARKFLSRFKLKEGQHVLDVACGTGVVSLMAADNVGKSGAVVAIDLNPGMLAIARAKPPSHGAHIDWQEGNAESLPFDDESFDAVLCQQGLQFFPSKITALREMRRVAKPDGRVGLCVWRTLEHTPCHAAIATALERNAGGDLATRLTAPYRFGEADQLLNALTEAGFRNVDIEADAIMRDVSRPEESIPRLIESTPIASDFAQLDESVRHAIVEETAAALADYRDGDRLIVPQATHIAVGTA